VAVEVAAGAVAVLGGAWVGISGEDLSVAQGISPSRRSRQRMTRIGNVEWQSDASPEERTSATPSGGDKTQGCRMGRLVVLDSAPVFALRLEVKTVPRRRSSDVQVRPHPRTAAGPIRTSRGLVRRVGPARSRRASDVRIPTRSLVVQRRRHARAVASLVLSRLPGCAGLGPTNGVLRSALSRCCGECAVRRRNVALHASRIGGEPTPAGGGPIRARDVTVGR
jgi:hypothetical protein